MKKTTAFLAAAILVMAMLTSCGAKSGSYANLSQREDMSTGAYDGAANSGSGSATAPAMPPMPETDYGVVYDEAYRNSGEDYIDKPIMPTIPRAGDGLNEKIIYSAYAHIETVDFDTTIDAVYELMDSYGAFVENSSVSGKSHEQAFYSAQAHRMARFTIRVPKDSFVTMTTALDGLGNVTSLENSAQNITSQFIDTESRLKASRTEETRLLEILAKADTVSDMIVIEERLSEVRYQIESMTSSLKNWQNQIDYSTLSLNISEVEKLTEIVPVHRSYWSQISDGFKSSVHGIGKFFMGVFKWLIISMPVIILLAAICVCSIFVGNTIYKRTKKRKMTEKDDKGESN